MFKQCYKKKDKSLIKNYKNYCNLLTSVKRVAKQKYYTSMIEMNKKNLSKQWKLINEILQRNRNQKDPINKLVIDNNVILTECKDICNNLNDFFVKIGPTMASKITSAGTSSEKNLLNFISSSPESFLFEPCTEFEVFRELINLNKKKQLALKTFQLGF